MALNPSNSSSLEQLALKGLKQNNEIPSQRTLPHYFGRYSLFWGRPNRKFWETLGTHETSVGGLLPQGVRNVLHIFAMIARDLSICAISKSRRMCTHRIRVRVRYTTYKLCMCDLIPKLRRLTDRMQQ